MTTTTPARFALNIAATIDEPTIHAIIAAPNPHRAAVATVLAATTTEPSAVHILTAANHLLDIAQATLAAVA